MDYDQRFIRQECEMRQTYATDDIEARKCTKKKVNDSNVMMMFS